MKHDRVQGIFALLRQAAMVLLLAALAGCSMAQPQSRPSKAQNVVFAGPPVLGQENTGAAELDLLPPQSLPAVYEQVWVIEKPSPQIHRNEKAELAPGSGMLLARTGQNLVNCPVKHTQYSADVTGTIATVDISQQFSNPTNQLAEMIYSFSLPDGAGASDFVMSIGSRHIRGIVREREEARQIYQQARSQGYLVSLLGQTVPNVYVQSVANVQPGKLIDVRMRYFHAVEYREGWYTMTFPLVAGAHGRNWPQPAGRNGRDVSVTARLNPGMPMDRVECDTHSISVSRPDPAHATATLDSADTIPNMDLVLRFKAGGEGIRSSLVTQRDGAGECFSLTLLPPDDWRNLPRRPLELILIASLSNPASLIELRTRGEQVLRSLHPQDTFSVMNLPDDRKRPPIAATRENIDSLKAYSSATILNTGQMLQLAASMPPDPSRQRLICLMTDGVNVASGSDLGLGNARLLLVGLESSDRAAINGMAAICNGAALYCEHRNDVQPFISDTIERFAHPVLSDVELDMSGPNREGNSRSQRTQLLPGHPLVLSGRVNGGLGNIAVTGKTASGAIRLTPSSRINLPADGSLSALCARSELGNLLKGRESSETALSDQIRKICLEHGLVSRFTSYICVDARTQQVGIMNDE